MKPPRKPEERREVLVARLPEPRGLALAREGGWYRV